MSASIIIFITCFPSIITFNNCICICSASKLSAPNCTYDPKVRFWRVDDWSILILIEFRYFLNLKKVTQLSDLWLVSYDWIWHETHMCLSLCIRQRGIDDTKNKTELSNRKPGHTRANENLKINEVRPRTFQEGTKY